MAFKQFPFFQSIDKTPEILQKEALVSRVKDILLPHNPRDMLSSRYLNAVHDHYGKNLGVFIDGFEGSTAEELVKSLAPLAETLANEIGVVGQALAHSGVIDKLHVSDKLVDRSTVIKIIIERLINKHIDDAQMRQNLMPLADLFQAEYNAKNQAASDVNVKPVSVAA